jgi:hypothetical protein
MKQIGRHLWPHLVALWSTKNASLKEQLVMAAVTAERCALVSLGKRRKKRRNLRKMACA